LMMITVLCWMMVANANALVKVEGEE